ncbi:hypothetical protein M569_08631, partial [Genlisea aurea]
GNSSSLILAERRTRRKDPLNNFAYYTGGWNATNVNYFASVVYTGFPLFLVSAIWFLGFGLFLLLFCFFACCCRRRNYGYSRFAYAMSLVLLVSFTFAAIAGAAVLYTGQWKFHDSTTSTLDYVLEEADSTARKLENVSDALTTARDIAVDSMFLPRDVQSSIDRVNSKIDAAANALNNATRDNKDRIFHYLDIVGITLIIVAAVMLGLAVLGLFFSVAGLQFLVYILVIVGWILIAATFVMCGVFLVLHNLVGDTCVAMEEWVNNPTAHTALDTIIPCVDPATAQQALNQSKQVTFQVVRLVNLIVANVSNVDLPPGSPPSSPISYNQSGPPVPLLCNPYDSDLSNAACSSGEVEFRNATQVWRNYECGVSSNDANVCRTTGRLTPAMYAQMSGAVNVSDTLYRYGPFLTDLVDCSVLRDVFTRIYDGHCPDLRRYTRWVYVGLGFVSAGVLLSLVFWVIYARERRHR